MITRVKWNGGVSLLDDPDFVESVNLARKVHIQSGLLLADDGETINFVAELARQSDESSLVFLDNGDGHFWTDGQADSVGHVCEGCSCNGVLRLSMWMRRERKVGEPDEQIY